MKLKIIILICVLLSFKVSAQEQPQRINFILSIDEKIVSGSVSKIKILASLTHGGKRVIEADYYPGNLSLSQSDYALLKSDTVSSVFLSFTYSEFCNKNRRDYDYEIDLKKGWLQSYFYVLYVYNTDKSRYKKILEPLKGKHYIYEFDYPGGGTKRIRKIKINDCD
ncbi:hypothetical protein [Deminuibacter soli]|uniref:Uncharacterized protein n=1 Tax=Deminuibacter soli TaxID=2291815 RepID=A0A3E1NML8_9BACT|nr:hypothetical protein [Deminuibacter soli]RFM29058.1 hypothetical protein DXN05_09875 [Deminuibacter soli]